MNAPMSEETRSTALQAEEVSGGLFACLDARTPRPVTVILEEINRATLAGNTLILERRPSAPVLLPASMNFPQRVLTGVTGIHRAIKENEAFAEDTNFSGDTVYYRKGVVEPPMNLKRVTQNLKRVTRYVRKLMRANTNG